MSTVAAHGRKTSDLNTLPDPRSPSPLSAGSRTPSNGSAHHPDLSNEVAALSTKLINAINHQTNLDDNLQATRHELATARDRIAQLEASAQQHQALIDQGVLVRRVETDRIQNDLQTKIDEEQRKRDGAEKEKKGMEQELESLTSALFEEANTMVSTARQEREEALKKAEQLNTKLQESRILLTSHQDQLRDLKAVLQQVESEQSHADSAHASTAPSTPTTASRDKRGNAFDLHSNRHSTSITSGVPEPPLRWANLIHPVMRTDLSAYEDFIALLKVTKNNSPPSRVTSGNFSTGLNVMGLGQTNSTQSTVVKSHQHSGSSSSLPTSSSHTTPNQTSGTFTPSSPSESSSKDLKDTKFYKRILVEDLEPTLRLDTAPGLSWLARRSVLNSMLAGNLIVEPYAPTSQYYSPAYPCSLCGESRVEDEHVRRHRFRTSDNTDAQRYPLCGYCLSRIRASCDFVGFLRACKAGLWRGNESGDVELEGKAAWEEGVRLRERMFWARLGGGVVPANLIGHDSLESPSKPMISQRSAKSTDSLVVENSDLRKASVPSMPPPSDTTPKHSQELARSRSSDLDVRRPSTDHAEKSRSSLEAQSSQESTPLKLKPTEDSRAQSQPPAPGRVAALASKFQKETNRSRSLARSDDKSEDARTPSQVRPSVTIPGSFE